MTTTIYRYHDVLSMFISIDVLHFANSACSSKKYFLDHIQHVNRSENDTQAGNAADHALTGTNPRTSRILR